jgi:hypothetical protein
VQEKKLLSKKADLKKRRGGSFLAFSLWLSGLSVQDQREDLH